MNSASLVGHASNRPVLIVIPFGINIGFAIHRLIGVFYEMAVRLTGDPTRVHFAFTKVRDGRSPALPPDFDRFVEFDSVNPTPADVERLAAYVRASGIATVFALDLHAEAPFLPAVRRAGVGRVISYSGAPMSSINRGPKLALKRLEVALLRPSKPDLFIFESKAMQALGVRGRGLARASTTIVHTGVDPRAFRPAAGPRDAVYSRFDIPRDRRIVVYMGHLDERKGVHVLMRAARHVVRDTARADVHFLFLGQEEGQSERFRDLAAEANGHVTFGGYHADVPALLAGCYLGCIPSSGWDSFPMSSLEMQACGLPVVVSDLQGVPETIENGATGIVVPAGDSIRLGTAITDLVDDPARRDAMGQAARRRIETQLTRDHQIENLVRVVGSLGI